jgi:hypothetical protein
VDIFWVMRAVRTPKRAEAALASHPACPPPITTWMMWINE